MTDAQQQGARLEEFISALDETQTSFAQRVGLSQGYMSQMIGGSRTLSKKLLQFIAKELPDANVRWLVTGEGEMFLEKKEPEPGILEGVLEPDAEYVKGDGRLEWLERRVGELEVAVADLRRWREEMEEGKGD